MPSSLHIKTPLLESLPLSSIWDGEVYLKMEALQPSGSFKIRGIGNLCAHYAREGKAKCFLASSSGNAGLAVAYSGRKLGVPVKVVVPKITPKVMLEKLKAEGAQVTVHGAAWGEADALAQNMLQENPSYVYIPPFDHPLIWKGHESLVYELKEDGFRPDVIIVAVGGAGLLCGLIQGLHELSWSDVPVIAAEPEGAASLAASLQTGELVTLDKVDTIAGSLAAKRVTQRALALSKEHEIISVIVSDNQATKACVRFAEEHRVIVEPACGVALSVVYDRMLKEQGRFKKPLVVICGGNRVNLELLHEWGR